MLVKTKGIILRFVKYKETSVIASIYTVDKGLISVIANSVRSKNAKGKIALFQPLSLVEIVIYYNASKNISRISEINSYHPLHSLRQDAIKSSISIFIIELLNKCLKEEESNPPFYNFIQNSVIHLNEQTSEIENFHLIFLIKFTLFLGFKPNSSSDFIHQITHNSFYSTKEHLKALEILLASNYETKLNLTYEIRAKLLTDLLEYYQLHMDLGKINSIEVLHELLN